MLLLRSDQVTAVSCDARPDRDPRQPDMQIDPRASHSKIPFVTVLRSTDVAMHSTTTVMGGNYTCNATGNGAFLYTSRLGTTVVEGGLVKGCIAERRAGAVSEGGPPRSVPVDYLPAGRRCLACLVPNG